MDVVLTHPFFWPYVRRGAEREVRDLGARLAAAGCRVRLLTSTPEGGLRRRRDAGIEVTYVRAPRVGRLTSEAAFGLAALPIVPWLGGEVVHSFHYADAWAAVRGRKVRRRPVVLKLTGSVRPEGIARVPVDRRMFREAVAEADEVWCNSVFARDEMAGFGREMAIVPAGIDLDRFTPGAPAREPIVLCTAAANEPRKRVVDLVDAWPAVLAEVPDARLRLAGPPVPDLLDRLPSCARATVELCGVLDDDALVRAYRDAAVTVAPAAHEALGLATLESLACGTPVAGADSGATPELLSPDTGATFAPGDPHACAEAVFAALRLAGDPETGRRCRARAEPYGWGQVVDDVLARYVALSRSHV